MNGSIRTVIAVSMLFISACTNMERSRSLGNPSIPAKVIAEQVCSNCHGVTGSSVSPNFPNLAGQTETYLENQLRGFRGHSRSDPAGFEYMWGLSRHLSDEQIAGLAKYYADQSPALRHSVAMSSQAASGKNIFEVGLPDQGIPACMSCHGDKAQGNVTFPRLANQHADYIIKQLMVFQRTDERPEGSVMKTVAHGLTEQNMRDVAAYLQDFQ